MGWLANNYTFYIYVQALGGASLYYPITMNIINDCNSDSIMINPLMPGNSEQMSSAYQSVNSLPVLFINTTVKSPISVDISKRIINLYTSSC